MSETQLVVLLIGYVTTVVGPLVNPADLPSVRCVEVTASRPGGVVLHLTANPAAVPLLLGRRGANADALRRLTTARARAAGHRGPVDVQVGDSGEIRRRAASS